MAAEMTDEEWVGRWGLQRGATVGVDDHLTMMLAEDESGTPILIPPPPDTVLTYNEPTPGAPAATKWPWLCSCVYDVDRNRTCGIISLRGSRHAVGRHAPTASHMTEPLAPRTLSSRVSCARFRRLLLPADREHIRHRLRAIPHPGHERSGQPEWRRDPLRGMCQPRERHQLSHRHRCRGG